MRRVDRTGKPRGDVIPAVVAPGARALDAVGTETGLALAWWNWSGTPHQLAVTFLDNDGRAAGRAVPVTRAPSPNPTVDIAPGAALGRRAQVVLAWDEPVDQREHIFVGEVGATRLEGRINLGLGETPRMGNGVVVWEHAHEQAVYTAPLAGGNARAWSRATCPPPHRVARAPPPSASSTTPPHRGGAHRRALVRQSHRRQDRQSDARRRRPARHLLAPARRRPQQPHRRRLAVAGRGRHRGLVRLGQLPRRRSRESS